AWSGTGSPTQALRHWDKVRELADGAPESPETRGLGWTARVFLLQFGWRLGIAQDEAETLFAEAEALVADGDLHSRSILLATHGAVKGIGDGDVREFTRLERQAFAL